MDAYRFLHRVLFMDFAASLATMVLFLGGSPFLEHHAALAGDVVLLGGAILLPWCCLVAYAWLQERPGVQLILSIVVLNGVWIVLSLVALFSGRLQPNALGTGFVLIQAAVVACFATLQVVGLKRANG